MAAPIHFLPRLKREHATPTILAARGLADLLRDTPPADCPLYELPAGGPDGQPGCVLAINAPGRTAPARFGYFPKSSQIWRQINPDLWLGLDEADPPLPAELQRPSRRTSTDGRPLPPHPGHLVTCADGRTWEIPIVRRPDDSTSLPRFMAWDDRGNFTLDIDPAYRAIWDATAEVTPLFFHDGTPGTLPYERAAELCVVALAMNYRVTRELASLARLLRTDDWTNILGALLDFPTYLAAAQTAAEAKRNGRPTPADNPAQDCPPDKSPPLPPTVAGPPVGPPATDPAAAS